MEGRKDLFYFMREVVTTLAPSVNYKEGEIKILTWARHTYWNKYPRKSCIPGDHFPEELLGL